MSFKEDPLSQSRPAPRALWLGKENMAEARDNFWQAFNSQLGGQGNQQDRHTWNVAFAAAVAAISYIFEGRVEP